MRCGGEIFYLRVLCSALDKGHVLSGRSVRRVEGKFQNVGMGRFLGALGKVPQETCELRLEPAHL